MSKENIKTFSLTDKAVIEKIVVQGNSKIVEDGLTSDWSCSTLKFNAVCKGKVKVRFHIKGENVISYSAYVDGECVDDFLVPVLTDKLHGIYEACFEVGEEYASREIQIVRKSECTVGCCEIIDFSLEGELRQTKRAKKLIEFVGDSITCGSSSFPTEIGFIAAGNRSYAFLTVQRLGVDYRIRCKSGSGFLRSAGGRNEIGFSWDKTYAVDSYVRSEQTPYSFDRQADIVCIYLGTNDRNFYCDLKEDERNALFVPAIIKLINIIKPYNPTAKFVWLTGGMTNCYKDAVITAMADLGGEASGYYVCELPSGLKAGGAGHPDYKQHVLMSEVLNEFLLQKSLVK